MIGETTTAASIPPRAVEGIRWPERLSDVPLWLLRMTVLPLPPVRSPIDGRTLQEAREHNAIYLAFRLRRENPSGLRGLFGLVWQLAPQMQAAMVLAFGLQYAGVLDALFRPFPALIIPALIALAVIRNSPGPSSGIAIPYTVSGLLSPESRTRPAAGEDLWLAASPRELGEAAVLERTDSALPGWMFGLAVAMSLIALYIVQWDRATTVKGVVFSLGFLWVVLRNWDSTVLLSSVKTLRSNRTSRIRWFPIAGVGVTSSLGRGVRGLPRRIWWGIADTAYLALLALMYWGIGGWIGVVLAVLGINALISHHHARLEPMMATYVEESQHFVPLILLRPDAEDRDAFAGIEYRPGQYDDLTPSLQCQNRV